MAASLAFRRTAVLTALILAPSSKVQAQSSTQIPLEIPNNGTATSEGLTFPVALPESFAAVDNVDITLKLSKTPSLAPLVKIYCNPNYGDYALTSASTNAPSRIFSVWQSVSLRSGIELLQIGGRSDRLISPQGRDPSNWLVCSISNSDQEGTTVTWQLEGYAVQSSSTLAGQQQEALTAIHAACCPAAACSGWPISTLLNQPNMNFCIASKQRCSVADSNGAGVLLELDLSSVNLTCTLPTALLSQLTSLQSLKLANNPSLRGNTSQLFDVLAAMPFLQTLILDGSSNLVGSAAINSTAGKSFCSTWKNMSQISMKGLQLTGSLPSCLFAPSSSVTVLDVGNTQVEGELPDISAASNLQELYAPGCRLSGALPFDGNGLQALTHLDLSENNLPGTVPVGLGNSVFLSFLNLASNQLQGEQPLTHLHGLHSGYKRATA